MPKKPVEPICRNCKHAEWPVDSRGRRPLKQGGRCRYPIPPLEEVPLPIALLDSHTFRGVRDRFKNRLVEPSYIWAENDKPCDVFEPKETKP